MIKINQNHNFGKIPETGDKMIKYIKYNLTLIVISVMFLSSTSLISQWLPDTRLTNDTAVSTGSLNNGNWIAVSSTSIHVVWRDYRNNSSAVYYKRSTDNGTNWSTDIKINSVDSNAYNPVIAVSGSNVHIIWNDDRNDTTNLYYIKSTDNGSTWGSNIRLVTNRIGVGSSIYCNNSIIYVAWTDTHNNNNAEIYFKSSIDGGNNWSNNLRITNNNTASQFPSIDADNNTIHMIWLEQSPGYKIFYSKSTDGGLEWSDSLSIVNSNLPWVSSISVSGSNIHVAYRLQTAGNQFNNFYMRSTNNGQNWEPGIALTSSNSASMPVIESYGSVLQFVWSDYRSVENGIYYMLSTNNGINWTNESKITSGAVNQDNPCIVASNSALHVVWEDRRDGNSEIYYKRNLTGNGPYTVSGTVTYKDNNQPVQSGFVKALKYNSETAEIVTVDSTVINSNGTYMLSHMPSEVLDLMYYQDDDLLQFVPTYYVSTIDWREATQITPTGNLTNINCQVFRINNTANPFTISGQVTANLDNSSVSSMKDAIVYAKSGSTFRNYGISNGNGSYITTKLPSGSYELITHRMGFAPVTQNVTITNSSLSNINFDMGSPLIGINIINENIPTKYLLSQNYPNPFNPATTIKFSVPAAGLFKLTVYNILGREIEILANEDLAAGSYSVNWDASNHPSGIYFYRLEGSDFTETKKMVLIK